MSGSQSDLEERIVMAGTTQQVPLTLGPRAGEMFPTLTPAQIARLAAHGRTRQVQEGEVLVEAGERMTKFFVVTAGQLEAVRPSVLGGELVAVLEPGMFSGEVSMLSGRRGLVQVHAARDGEVIEINRQDLLTLVQTDSELSDTLMRGFILRRVELIAHGFGDVVLIGSNNCAETLRIKDFLMRNGHPYSFIDLDRDKGVQ